MNKNHKQQLIEHLARKYVSLCYAHIYIDDNSPHMPAEYDAVLVAKEDYSFMSDVERFMGLGEGNAGPFRGAALYANIKDIEKIMECMMTDKPTPFFLR